MRLENKQQKAKGVKVGFWSWCKDFWKRNYIYIIMVSAAILRVVLGYCMGGWHEVNALYDDGAMMRGLSLERLVAPNEWALIKHLGFSVFLGITAVSNLPYTVMLSLFWVLATTVIFMMVRKLTDKKWVQLGAFLYVLFLPIAFTSWGGLRIYRNAIIPPAIILTFGLALILIIDIIKKEKTGRTIGAAICTGLSFSFTYFLKEDGIWMELCMAVVLVICLGIIISRYVKEKTKDYKLARRYLGLAAIAMVPFVIFFVSDNVYKGLNHYFFGVYEINTRTEGELGKFVYNIYKIDSPNRKIDEWAPYDAIEAAFKASATLQKYPQLLEKIKTTEWYDGDIIKNPIKRDFLTWVMRTELVDAKMWQNEKQVNELFRVVNNELAESFRDGTLKKAEGRIQLLASTGGYTLDEIRNSDLMARTWAGIAEANWMPSYEIGFYDEEVAYATKGKEWDYGPVNKVLHMENDVNIIGGGKRAVANKVGEIICVIYRIINTVLFVVTPVFIIWVIVDLMRNRKKLKSYMKKNGVVIGMATAATMFLGVTILYSFATAWFFISPAGTAHGGDVFIFYSVGVPGLLAMTYVTAMVGMSEKWRLMRRGAK